MPSPILQFKRGEWNNLPGLRSGEPAFTLDTYDFYIGINSSTQGNKFFGSHRYWGREDGSDSLKLKLVDKNGTNSIHLKSPNTLSGVGTYVLPDTNTIVDEYFLKVNDSGTLSWSNSFSSAQISSGIFSGITTFLGLIDAKFGINVTGDSEFDNINVSGIATLPQIDVNDINVIGQSNFNGIGVTGISTFTSEVYFYDTVTGTISTAVSVGVNSNTLDSNLFYPVFVDTFESGFETLYSNNTISLNPFSGDFILNGNIKISGNSILDSNDNNVITFNGSGDVDIINDLTVNGDFYVKGTTTEINSISLTIEDRTVDLGFIDGSEPSFPTTWDLGILFNYYTTSAKKSALIWEHENSRFQFAKEISIDTDEVSFNSPQLDVTVFSPIEISSLWVTDCAGTSKVIDCVDEERVLENIVLDAGFY